MGFNSAFKGLSNVPEKPSDSRKRQQKFFPHTGTHQLDLTALHTESLF